MEAIGFIIAVICILTLYPLGYSKGYNDATDYAIKKLEEN